MKGINNVRRVAVLRGGPSEEYEISMNTGAGVLKSLSESPYSVEDIVISKKGEWLKNGVVREPKDALAATDVVFIALHGAYGEDGTVQRILERLSIPYTGSGPYSSALAMNKMLTKEQLKHLDVKMAPQMRITKEATNDVSRIVHTITNLFGPEYVVKPIAGGSSIGTRMANSPSFLVKAIEGIFETHDDVLVEQRIRGREATCGVVENFRNEKVYRLPAIEIVPPLKSEFYSADVKYSGETDVFCPSRFKQEQKKKLEELAFMVHGALSLSQYSRSDFIVADDGIYFLEVNTLPYIASESPYITALQSVGSSHRELIETLIENAHVQGTR